jgi:hypothetical protein
LNFIEKRSIFTAEYRLLKQPRTPLQRAPECFAAAPPADLLMISGEQDCGHLTSSKFLWPRILRGIEEIIRE